MEGEGGSKYMKMVVRETIAWATLERGTLQSPTHTSAKLQQQSTLSPHQKYHQETFKMNTCVGVSWMLRGSKTELILIEKASTSVLWIYSSA